VQIDFTAEGLEYWRFLHDHEPDTLVKLYREMVPLTDGHVITLEELQLPLQQTYSGSRYNPNNKYNTELGCVHLNCHPNTVEQEVVLAAEATVLRKDTLGAPITDTQALCNCSKYGVCTRNSDPTIGAYVNAAVRAGYKVSLQDPVGLYISSFDTNGWTDPEGNDIPVKDIVKLTRGSEGKALHYKLRVPDNLKYVLGDVLIGGVPIRYGSEVARLIRIGITGIITKEFPVRYEYCVGQQAKARSVAQHQQAEGVAPEALSSPAIKKPRVNRGGRRV